NAHIDVLGYKHIAELVNDRFYANQVRSIEYAELSKFFTRNADLSGQFSDYFESFDLVITYLFDPDRIFENNLRRCGVERIVVGPAKISAHTHAARQLAQPLLQLGVTVNDWRSHLYPSIEDREAARSFLADLAKPIVAIHPGSGSESKNWPLENWIQLGNQLLALDSRSGGFPGADGGERRFGSRRSLFGSIVIVCGEADERQAQALESIWQAQPVRFAKNFPLPHLAAILENTIFAGHDSGISHLAAAVGAKCTLLFGPSDPDIWAPNGDHVRVIRAPNGNLSELTVDSVSRALPL
ncbi:MAG: heptosyltransferase, partial [Verrucomicrobiota bacterium]